VISIKGKKHILWRAVDQDGFVLGILVQKHRDTKAAKRFIRKLLSGPGCSPRVMVTDKFGSYSAANREIGLSVSSQHDIYRNSLPFTTLFTIFITSQETNSVSPITVNYAKPQPTCGAKSYTCSSGQNTIRYSSTPRNQVKVPVSPCDGSVYSILKTLIAPIGLIGQFDHFDFKATIDKISKRREQPMFLKASMWSRRHPIFFGRASIPYILSLVTRLPRYC
jgi:hypothetical protein